ncbi:hypothetical protein [Legionella erythra]|uniref:Uncharacterized protein n=1 Tax=Legionella erythra TaxID=448 RepID=A0A0W0TTH1_LEGER|nr:hypothetical protein [Legionella erythra]KTC98699.1 hypothetical protein Lery_0863 [Legionella erythra]
MSNYKILVKWLENSSIESLENDLKFIKKVLSSIQSLITNSVSMTPLEFANKLHYKLELMAKFYKEKSEIDELNKTLSKYTKQLENLLPEAQKKAELILEVYLHVEKRKYYDFEHIFNHGKAVFEKVPDWIVPDLKKDDSKVHSSKEELTEDPHFKLRKGGFYTATSTFLSYFTEASQAYMKHWAVLEGKLPYFEDLIKKYPSNQFASIFKQDKKDIVNLIMKGEYNFHSELGSLLFGRILYESPGWGKNERMQVYRMHLMNESETQFIAEEFKYEIMKISLFSTLAKESGKKAIAWIGTSRSVMAKVNQNPGEGAFLNCDDDKWSPQLNRAWLISLLMLDYQIQMVEPQFPTMEKAILSGDLFKYIECLLSEIRKYDGSTNESLHKNDSMYNGGIEPTATMQELLFLLSMGCRSFKDSQGLICLVTPGIKEEPTLTKKNEVSGYMLQRTHSFSEFGRIASNPVAAGAFFRHPGASTDQRCGKLNVDSPSSLLEDESDQKYMVS